MNHQHITQREAEQAHADFWERQRVKHYRNNRPARPVPVTTETEVEVEDVAEE